MPPFCELGSDGFVASIGGVAGVHHAEIPMQIVQTHIRWVEGGLTVFSCLLQSLLDNLLHLFRHISVCFATSPITIQVQLIVTAVIKGVLSDLQLIALF